MQIKIKKTILHLIIIFIEQMGCASSQKQRQQLPPPPSNSAGLLKITITNAILFHQAGAFKMDPYVILKLSNQNFRSKVSVKGGKKPTFMETFEFYINSCHKQYGRNLQVTMMDKKKIGNDDMIGFGNVDLNPIINQKKGKQQFRCMLNFEYKEAGFLNLIAEFVQQQIQIIHFRFEQAVIRRQTSTFGSANCWIQATVGEEIMHTNKHKNNKKKPPSWLTEVLTFKVFKSIKECFIRVMDDGIQIGHLTINLDKVLASQQQQYFAQDFVFEKGTYAGTLKFRTIKGKAPSFSNQKISLQTLLSDEKQVQNLQKQYFSKLKQNPYATQQSNQT